MNRNRFRLPSVGAVLLRVMAMFTIVVSPLFSTQIATAQSPSSDAVQQLFLPFLSCWKSSLELATKTRLTQYAVPLI